MTLASSSVSVLLRYVFFTRSVCPEGKVQPVLGMGGSPSFCCSLSAMTRNALRPIFILCTKKNKSQVHRVAINFHCCIVSLAGKHHDIETTLQQKKKKINCTSSYFSNWELPSNRIYYSYSYYSFSINTWYKWMLNVYLWIKTKGFCGFSDTKKVKDNLFHGKIKSFL